MKVPSHIKGNRGNVGNSYNIYIYIGNNISNKNKSVTRPMKVQRVIMVTEVIWVTTITEVT